MPGEIRGKIISVRESGDLVSDIARDDLRGLVDLDKFSIHCDGHVTMGIFEQDHAEPPMTLLAVWNQEQRLELRLVDANASTFLGIRPGARLLIEW